MVSTGTMNNAANPSWLGLILAAFLQLLSFWSLKNSPEKLLLTPEGKEGQGRKGGGT